MIIASLLAAFNLTAAPAPPKSQSAQDVGDWVAANLWPMGYFPFDRVNGGVSYLSLSSEQDLRAPVVRAWVRYEYFEPRAMNGRLAQSERLVLDLDCAQGRVRAQTVERFAGSNLQGVPEVIRMDGGWTTPEAGTLSHRQLTFLCEAKKKIAAGPPRAAAPVPPASQPGAPPPPASAAETDIEAWIAAYIDTERAFRFEYQPNAAVFLYVPEKLVAGKPAKLDIRHEYFRPLRWEGRSVRSDYAQTEVDCERGLMRVMSIETFPELNTQGEGRLSDKVGPWATPPEGELARASALVCREMREPGYARSVQKGADTPPVAEGPPAGRVVPRRR